jgi:streptogramin lyase
MNGLWMFISKGRSQGRACRDEVKVTRPETQARVRVESLESRNLLSAIINEYPVTTTLPITGPSDIAVGPDGNLWFTGTSGTSIGEINPTTHAVTQFTVSTTSPGSITAGSDGNLWFTDDDKIAEFNPTSHTLSEFTIPAPTGTFPFALAITAGPDGNIWFGGLTYGPPFLPRVGFTGHPLIGEINLTTHALTEISLQKQIGEISGITAGPDGNVWFAGSSTPGPIGTINVRTHAIKLFSLPARDSASDITAGPDGNLWFTVPFSNKVGRINPKTHAIAEFRVPTANSDPVGITSGSDGNIWFTEAVGNKLGRLNPKTRAVSEFPIPNSPTSSSSITAGPDGNLWFTEDLVGKVGQFVDGPTVLSLGRSGRATQPAKLVLSFSKPLNPARALSLSNYRLVTASGRSIGLSSVAYDPVHQVVTLVASRALNVRQTYLLAIVGTGPFGLTDTAGNLLDGAGTGQPGSNFVARVPKGNGR